MRIYLDNLDIKHINRDNLSSCQVKQKQETNIYSESGIFKIVKGKIVVVSIIDKPVEKIIVDGISLYLDNSKEVIDDQEHFQIPVEHVKEDINVLCYSLRSKSLIDLIIVMADGTIRDLYFHTDSSINTIGIKDDIFSFLSLLKFTHSI